MPSPMPLVEPVTSASFSTEEAAVVAAMIDIPAVYTRTRYPVPSRLLQYACANIFRRRAHCAIVSCPWPASLAMCAVVSAQRQYSSVREQEMMFERSWKR